MTRPLEASRKVERVLVVDDEPLARDVLRRLIDRRDDLELLAEAKSGSEALEVLEQQHLRGDPLDLVLLDVEMPGLDGFELLDELTRRGLAGPAIVFVTAYDRYAVRAFETQAIDYLVKPVTGERFEKALERCKGSRRSLTPAEVKQLLADALVTAPDRLLVRRGNRIIPVAVSEVDWVEAKGDYVKLHSGGESFLIERTLSEMERLLEPCAFRRIHRSALVNERRIAELSPIGSGRYELRLEDGTTLVVSRTYSARFKNALI